MGFKKCEPHKKYSERWGDPYKMTPDTHEMKHQTVNGKRVFIQVKKEHPKWRIFYKLIARIQKMQLSRIIQNNAYLLVRLIPVVV